MGKLLRNKKLIIVIAIVIVLIISGILSIIIPKLIKKNDTDDNVIIVDDVEIDSEDDILLEDENNVIGTIEIPKLQIKAPIKEGIDQDTLQKYVGHFTNSSIWDGNVALASHNRGSLVEHYFEKIHELVNGDTIIYKTKLGERTYQVTTVKEIENTDWSPTESETKEKNTITLVTCIANHPEKRMCVIAEEKI